MKKYDATYSQIQKIKSNEILSLKKNPILSTLYVNKDKSVSELIGLDYISYGRLVDDNGVFISGRQIDANRRNEKMVAVVLADNVEVIGKESFSGCADLKFFQANAALKSIGIRAFSSCDSLKYVELNEGLEEIGNRAFYRCYAIHDGVIRIPGTVKKLGKEIFKESDVERIVTTKEVAENYIKTNVDTKGMEIVAVEGDKLYYYKINKPSTKAPTVRRKTYDWPYGLDEAEKVYSYHAGQLLYDGRELRVQEAYKLSSDGEWKPDIQYKNKIQRFEKDPEEAISVESAETERTK